MSDCSSRPTALVLAIILFIVFAGVAYWGVQTTGCAAIIFGLLVGLIFLLFFYPPSNVQSDPADFTLWLYAAAVGICLVTLALYIIWATLNTSRVTDCGCVH